MFPPYLGINWSVNFNKDVLLLTWTAVLAALGNWQVLVAPLAPTAPTLSVTLSHCPQYCPSLSGSLLRFPANTGTGGSYLHLSSPVEHILSIHLHTAQSTQLQPMEGIEWQIAGLSSKLFTCMFLSRLYIEFFASYWQRVRERERERGANGTDREL